MRAYQASVHLPLAVVHASIVVIFPAAGVGICPRNLRIDPNIALRLSLLLPVS
jgi:hypothetical protein